MGTGLTFRLDGNDTTQACLKPEGGPPSLPNIAREACRKEFHPQPDIRFAGSVRTASQMSPQETSLLPPDALTAFESLLNVAIAELVTAKPKGSPREFFAMAAARKCNMDDVVKHLPDRGHHLSPTACMPFITRNLQEHERGRSPTFIQAGTHPDEYLEQVGYIVEEAIQEALDSLGKRCAFGSFSSWEAHLAKYPQLPWNPKNTKSELEWQQELAAELLLGAHLDLDGIWTASGRFWRSETSDTTLDVS